MADYFSSEDEEDTLAEGEEEEETQSGDDFCLTSDSEDEPMDTRRGKFSKRDALEGSLLMYIFLLFGVYSTVID